MPNRIPQRRSSNKGWIALLGLLGIGFWAASRANAAPAAGPGIDSPPPTPNLPPPSKVDQVAAMYKHVIDLLTAKGYTTVPIYNNGTEIIAPPGGDYMRVVRFDQGITDNFQSFMWGARAILVSKTWDPNTVPQTTAQTEEWNRMMAAYNQILLDLPRLPTAANLP